MGFPVATGAACGSLSRLLRASLPVVLLLAATPLARAAEAIEALPLPQWRESGVETRKTALPDGRTLVVPVHEAIMCTYLPVDSTQWGNCSLRFERGSGRMVGFSDGPVDLAAVVYDLQPGTYLGALGMARGNPKQWGPNLSPEFLPPDGVPTDKPYEGPVRGRLEGEVDGHPYWVGCWGRRDAYPFAYGCSLAVDHGRNGSSITDFATKPPPGDDVYAPDRAEMEALVRLVVGIRSSFEEGR